MARSRQNQLEQERNAPSHNLLWQPAPLSLRGLRARSPPKPLGHPRRSSGTATVLASAKMVMDERSLGKPVTRRRRVIQETKAWVHARLGGMTQ